MSQNLLWIGGWGSPLDAMEKEIAALYPGWRHQFMDGMEASLNPARLEEALLPLSPSDWVIAWSLGSLALHRLLLSQSNAHNPYGASLLSLCPIVDFVNAIPQREAMLRAMQGKLRYDKDRVLHDFWNSAAKDTPYANRFAALCARRMDVLDPTTLSQGLDYLRDVKVDPLALVKKRDQLFFLTSPEDPISPCPFARERFDASGAPREISRRITYYGKGHIPFLTEAESIGKLLSGI